MKIKKDDSLHENIVHGSEAFPFAYYYEDVYDFDFHTIDWHWHKEVEFVYLKSGEVEASVGGDTITLHEGELLFINSGVLHELRSSSSAIIPNIVFAPRILAPEESQIYSNYVLPVLNMADRFLIFHPENASEHEVIDVFTKLLEVVEANNNELRIAIILMNMWEKIFLLTQDRRTDSYIIQTPEQLRLQQMLAYIHTNFADSISLEDIAQSANISKSSALKVFDSTLHISPVAYLLNYRLKQAASLLRDTPMTLDGVAKQSGFHDTAYFCRRFKIRYQRTPSEYRKKS